MRHPVSTPGRESRESGSVESNSLAMEKRIVEGAVLKATPQNAEPGSRENPDGMRVAATALASSLVYRFGPGRSMTGVVGPSGDRAPEPFVAGIATGNAAMAAGGAGGVLLDRRFER